MRFLFLLVLVLSSLKMTAQLSYGGQPYAMSKTRKANLAVPKIILPRVDTEGLLKEDQDNQDLPPRFAYAINEPIHVLEEGIWTEVEGGWICQLSIQSPEAKSLSLIFDQFNLPKGSALYFIGEHQYIGKFDDRSNQASNRFAIQPLKGEVLNIELFVEDSFAKVDLHIEKILHGYLDFGDAGSSHLNVACEEAECFKEQARSVVMTVVDGNTRWCTGTLLNNAREDGTPYFLTTNNCLRGDENTWVFIFNYQSPTCLNEEVQIINSLLGADIIARNDLMDFALLKLKITPPTRVNAYYAGWDVSVEHTIDSVLMIHYPKGDIKKVALADRIIVDSSHFLQVEDWSIGGAETGSSGAPLFNQEGRVIGQLSNHGTACEDTVKSRFGKFSRAYNWTDNPLLQLEEWLNPDGDSVLFMDGLSLIEPNAVLDLAISRVEGIHFNSCIDNFRPNITFRNLGSTKVDSIQVNITFDDSTWLEKYKLGIAFLEEKKLKLNKVFTHIGKHDLAIEVQVLNDTLVDSLSNNNRLNFQFEVRSGNYVNIQVKPDLSPEENQLFLYNSLGELIYQYDHFEPEFLWETDFCLEEDCYEVILTDEWGDGICCENGQGYFSMISDLGVELWSGSTFTDSASYEWCYGSSSVETIALDDAIQLNYDPLKNIVQIQNQNQVDVQIQIVDVLGRILYQQFTQKELVLVDLSVLDSPILWMSVMDLENGQLFARKIKH